MWEITFTSAFQEDLGRVPNGIFRAIDRLVEFLRDDPFARIPNAKRLKLAPDRFRARIADRFRLLYQVFSKEHRVSLVGLRDRQHVYDGKWPSARSTKTLPPGVLVFEIPARPKAAPEAAAEDEGEAGAVLVEPVFWISEDELFLLKIPEGHWSEVLAVQDLDGLDRTALSVHLRDRIADYLTSPDSSQIGRLYRLYEGSDAQSIAAQPLETFLLALDPDQKRLVELHPARGPYLVKGGPGTGKTLVGLHRLKRLVETRASEDIFSVDSPSFACLTYTNTLVGAMDGLLQRLLPPSGDYRLHVSTLDKLTFELAEKSLGRDLVMWSDSNTEGCIQAILRAYSESATARHREIAAFVESLGMAYAREEIVLVIQGNNVRSLAEYRALNRTGRRRSFSTRLRETFWEFYEEFERRREEMRGDTWDSMRQLALAQLKTDSSFPRFNFLFVDEVQDLSRVARQICIELVRDVRFLFLTADTGQSIYIHPPTWAETDARLRLTGRTFPLRRNYRTTRQIADAIAPLRKETDDGVGFSGHTATVFTGDLPHWTKLPIAAHPDEVVRLLKYLTEERNVNAGQIAIVLRERQQVPRYLQVLEAAEVPADVVDKSNPISLCASHVHILLAHSSKGLEFPIVIAPEVSDAHFPLVKVLGNAKDDGEQQEILEMERRLLYVALSRACSHLYLIADDVAPSRFLTELRQEDWAIDS